MSETLSLHGVGSNAAKQSPVSLYMFSDISADGVYVGKVKFNGSWLLSKLTDTGGALNQTYANISNNPDLTTYALAWASREVANYDYFSALTLV